MSENEFKQKAKDQSAEQPVKERIDKMTDRRVEPEECYFDSIGHERKRTIPASCEFAGCPAYA